MSCLFWTVLSALFISSNSQKKKKPKTSSRISVLYLSWLMMMEWPSTKGTVALNVSSTQSLIFTDLLSATCHAYNSPHICDLSSNIPLFSHFYASCLHQWSSNFSFFPPDHFLLHTFWNQYSSPSKCNTLCSGRLSVDGVANPSFGTLSKPLPPILTPRRGVHSVKELEDWHKWTQMQEFFQGNF